MSDATTTVETDVTVGRFMVFDIGCLECGEGSDIIGFFGTKESAILGAKAASIKQQLDWNGQHDFAIFDLSDGSCLDYDYDE